MNPKPQEPKAAKAAKPASVTTRDERLKAALKANMARRKAQAKARSTGRAEQHDGADDTAPNESE
ncbi:hypothetical protein GU927_005130 [Rhodobacteraceae bacterium HSP-20]|uniref:DUF4169 domain-containing protein n=1 Tax=Paragemmobacter amnigenus TaxID=2852097 RepID=A0ABS6J0D5_9RHOB|nr:hypothetical protein [Rhodobacter amnigenus]MBU9697226.1 hypothetical protein [Rhodobacter amnigenus]MBV4388453.1 hypothetical protein [Rhodobacter amnigenus]